MATRRESVLIKTPYGIVCVRGDWDRPSQTVAWLELSNLQHQIGMPVSVPLTKHKARKLRKQLKAVFRGQ